MGAGGETRPSLPCRVGDEILVPVRAVAGSAVAVPVSALPADPIEVIDVLHAELPPLDTWLHFAQAYLAKGDEQGFLALLVDGQSPEVEQFYPDSPYERISILCAAAGHHARKGKESRDSREKTNHFSRASGMISMAQRIDQREQRPFLAKALLAVAKGNLEEATKAFDAAMERRDNGRENIAPAIGKAAVCFAKRQYAEALRLYERALRTHPDAPAAVRLGLGACHFRLGNRSKSTAAYQRVLQLAPGNADALLGLATIALTRGQPGTPERRDSVREGLELLERAYAADPTHSGVLNKLAEHFLIAGAIDKVEHLVGAAFVSTGVVGIRAESCYHLARAHHSLGNLKEAKEWYSASVRVHPDFTAPHLGLGQIALSHGDTKAALMHFEKVHQEYPRASLVCRALGHLYSKAGRDAQKAVALLRQAAEHNPMDVGVWLEIGELLERTDATEALKAYEKAIKLLDRRDNVSTPYMLLNNVAVLHAQVKDAEGARTNFARSLRIAGCTWAADLAGRAEARYDPKAAAPTGEVSEAAVPVVFNLARMEEDIGSVPLADALYGAILASHPAVAECHMRRAAMASSSNKLDKAVEHAERALEVRPGYADALCCLGQLHLRLGEWDKADARFNELRAIDAKGSTKSDEYAIIGLANSSYLSSVKKEEAHKRSTPAVWERESAHLDRAQNYFLKALQKAPTNLWAANGAGIIMAERGKLSDAHDIFAAVEEGLATEAPGRLPDVWVNLAHTYLAEENFTRAIKMYDVALERFYNKQDASVLLYKARAEYDMPNLTACKKTLLRALHLSPNDMRLRYNIAYVMQEHSHRVLEATRDKIGSEGRVEEVQDAVEELGMALNGFEQLLQLGAQPQIGLDQRRLQMHVQFCTGAYDRAQLFLEQARQEDAMLKDRQRAQDEARAALEAAKQAEEEATRREIERQKELEQRRAEADKARLDQMKEQWKKTDLDVVGEDEEKGKKKRKPKQADVEMVDAEDEPEPEPDVAAEAVADAGLESEEDEPEYQEEPEEEDDDIIVMKTKGGVEYRDREEEKKKRALKKLGEKTKVQKKKAKQKRKAEKAAAAAAAAGEGAGAAGEAGEGSGAAEPSGRKLKRARAEGGEDAAAVAVSAAGLESDDDEPAGDGTEKKPRRGILEDDSDDGDDAGGEGGEAPATGGRTAVLADSDEEMEG